jgi:hypothetical protein
VYATIKNKLSLSPTHMHADKATENNVGINCRQRNAGVYKTADLETPQERRRRWWSIRIIYFTMFIMTLGFSIVLTGVWPFLDSVRPTRKLEPTSTIKLIFFFLVGPSRRQKFSWLRDSRQPFGPNDIFTIVRLLGQ